MLLPSNLLNRIHLRPLQSRISNQNFQTLSEICWAPIKHWKWWVDCASHWFHYILILATRNRWYAHKIGMTVNYVPVLCAVYEHSKIAASPIHFYGKGICLFYGDTRSNLHASENCYLNPFSEETWSHWMHIWGYCLIVKTERLVTIRNGYLMLINYTANINLRLRSNRKLILSCILYWH